MKKLKKNIKTYCNKISKKTKNIIYIVISILIVFGIVFKIIDTRINVFTDKVVIEDPFKYINIVYSGTTGSGIAKLNVIENNNDGINQNIIHYKVSKSDSLSEGEKITVEAKSEYYDIKNTIKEYTVSGLYLYLTSFENVNEETKKDIIEKSKKTLESTFNNLPNEAETTQMIHYNMYLVSDEKSSNYLYDIYKVTFKNKNKKEFTRFIAVVYENTTMVSGIDSINYSKTYLEGETIMYGQNNTYEEEDYIKIGKGFYKEEDIKLYFIKTYPKYKVFE